MIFYFYYYFFIVYKQVFLSVEQEKDRVYQCSDRGTMLTRQEVVVERHSETDVFHTRVSAWEDLALDLFGPFSIEPRHHAGKKTTVNSLYLARR